jgi:hypothetical protein
MTAKKATKKEFNGCKMAWEFIDTFKRNDIKPVAFVGVDPNGQVHSIFRELPSLDADQVAEVAAHLNDGMDIYDNRLAGMMYDKEESEVVETTVDYDNGTVTIRLPDGGEITAKITSMRTGEGNDVPADSEGKADNT